MAMISVKPTIFISLRSKTVKEGAKKSTRMQETRSSSRMSTQHSTLSSMSSAMNSQKGSKRKESGSQQPDLIATLNTNKKIKEAVEDNTVLNAEIHENDVAPWENFEPFSASKMSWILQELFSEIRENRRIINQLQQDVNTFQQNIQNLQLLDEKGKGKTLNAVKPATSQSAKAFIQHHSKGPFSYPLETIESLYELEAELAGNVKSGFHVRLISLLMVLPHPDEHQFLLNILNFLLKMELAVEFSYYGKAPCQCFKSLLLCEVIKKTVTKKFPDAGEPFFAKHIAAWIKKCKRQTNMKQRNLTL